MVKKFMMKFKCGEIQIHEAIQNKDKLMEHWASYNNSGKRKRMVFVGFKQVEKDLFR